MHYGYNDGLLFVWGGDRLKSMISLFLKLSCILVCGFPTCASYGICETFGTGAAPLEPKELCRGCPCVSNSPLKFVGSPKLRTYSLSYFSNDQMYLCVNRSRIRLLISWGQMGRSASLLQTPSSWVLADLSCWWELIIHETSTFLLFIGFRKKITTLERNITSTSFSAASLSHIRSRFLYLSLNGYFNEKYSLPYGKEVKWKARWHNQNLLIGNWVPFY